MHRFSINVEKLELRVCPFCKWLGGWEDHALAKLIGGWDPVWLPQVLFENGFVVDPAIVYNVHLQ